MVGCLFLSALVLLAPPVLAQSGGPYDLSWFTVDGGGGRSAGGTYTLHGTVGQADAGVGMSGGEYALWGGFWAGQQSIYSRIFLPLILRGQGP